MVRPIFLLLFALLACGPSFGRQRDVSRQPSVAWKFKAAGPFVGGAVLVQDLVIAGSHDSTWYALKLSDGTVKWKFRTRARIRSSAAVAGSMVIVNTGDGRIVGLDAASGRLVWSFATGGEKIYEPFGYADYFHSSPLCDSGVVYVGSGDGCLYALNSQSGGLIWKFQTGGPIHTTPVLHGSTVIAGSFDGTVRAFERANGRSIWSFKTVGHRFFPKGELQGVPVAGNGLICIGSRDYNVYAIDAEKGYCHWNKQFPLGWATALTVRDSALYVGTSDDDLMLAFDGRNGKESWRTNLQFNIFGPCVTSDSLLYVGTLMGRLHALDRRTGAVRWTLRTDGLAAHSREYFPSEENIVKNDFYARVGDPDGYIAALYELGAVFSSPLLAGDRLIVTSTDGTVYCFR